MSLKFKRFLYNGGRAYVNANRRARRPLPRRAVHLGLMTFFNNPSDGENLL
jgi:hypothetical protein